MIQLLGSCLGQLGSTLNAGPSANASDVANANPKKNTVAANVARYDFGIMIPRILQWRISPHWRTAYASSAHISGLRRVDSNGVTPRASNYFACVRLPERELSCPEMC